MGRTEKIRLDRLLVERGLVESREKAQGLILAGQILVDEQKGEKCGALVDAQAALRLLGEAPKYVSRGGLKLEGALKHFRINPDTKVCLDIGASTGGLPIACFSTVRAKSSPWMGEPISSTGNCGAIRESSSWKKPMRVTLPLIGSERPRNW